MIKKRINTDLFLSLAIKDAQGADVDMSAATDIEVYVRSQKSLKRVTHAFAISSNVVSLQYSADENQQYGKHNVTVEWNDPDPRSKTGIIHKAVDFVSAFEIVESTAMEENVEVTLNGIVYTFGAPGKSLQYSDLTPEQIAELQKPATDAAVLANEAADNANNAAKSIAGAVTQATDAAAKADKAVTDAETAVTNANNAVSNADKAISDTQQATKDAIAATKSATDATTNSKATDDAIKANETARNTEFATLKSNSEAATTAANDAAKKAVDSAAACDDTNKSVTDAETTRVAAETSRVNAENARVAAETSRVTEFNTMKTNSENATTTANEAATKADTAASHAPRIVDGVWQTWDTGTQSYVSTGIKAAGADGITPQLRINSTTFNWELSIDGGLKWIDMNVAAKQATSSASVVQVTGTSTDNVMSQKAIIDMFNMTNLLIYVDKDDVMHKIVYTYPSADTLVYLPFVSIQDSVKKILCLPDTSKQTSFYYVFFDNRNITYIPLMDASACKTTSNIFIHNFAIEYIGGFVNLKCSLNLLLDPLTRDNLMNIINNLADMTLAANQTWATNNSLTTTPTLTLGSTNLAKLTDADKKVATDKNWILA